MASHHAKPAPDNRAEDRNLAGACMHALKLPQ
jgi:hypothetical protein